MTDIDAVGGAVATKSVAVSPSVDDRPMGISEKIDLAITVAKRIIVSRPAAEDAQNLTRAILYLANARMLNESPGLTEELNEEVNFVLGKIRANLNGAAVVELAQAVLNLMNAKVLLAGKVKQKKPGASAS